jgi:hypothetical protein
MTDDIDTASSTESTPRPVRVPNVAPHAVSGLDHEVIGSNAQAAWEENQLIDALTRPIDTDPTEPEAPGIEVPAGTLEERIQWVASSDDEDERRERADAIWENEQDTNPGAPEEDVAKLSAALRDAVYGAVSTEHDDQHHEEPAPESIPEDVTSVPDLTKWVTDGAEGEQQRMRARTVLTAELVRDTPRKTLLDAVRPLADVGD